MLDNAGEFLSFNGKVIPVNQCINIDLNEKKIIYEVVRIIEEIPLFLDDHYNRLKNSMKLLEYELGISINDLKKRIKELIVVNKLFNSNVKIIIYYDNNLQNCLLYISKSYYPIKNEIENGVSVSLMNWERTKPNIKIENYEYKQALAKRTLETGAFEILLVNNKNEITEGGKSNVFFVKGSKVFTAPSEYVLKGITRQYIIEVCRKAGFEVIETLVNTKSLMDMDGAFISGTSIKVLPVSNIDNVIFTLGVHPSVTTIAKQFDSFIEYYITKHPINSF